MNYLKKKDHRIEFRIPSEIKELIERAALLKGLTLSSYATETLIEDARRVTEGVDRVRLGNKDRDAFLAILNRKATKKLQRSFAKAQAGSNDG